MTNTMHWIFLNANTGPLRPLRAAGGQLRVPVVALIGDHVLHAVNSDKPEFIPPEVLSSNLDKWRGKPLVFGHPSRNGEMISAASIGVESFGTLDNPRVVGHQLLLDALIDESKAPPDWLARLKNNEMLEVSVGAYVVTDNVAGTHRNRPYARKWLSLVPDHLAVVHKGACSCADGCGIGAGAYQRAASAPPDPYAVALAKIREQEATPESRFADAYMADRRRELELEYASYNRRASA